MELTLEQLGREIGADLEGDGACVVRGVCPLDDVRPDCVTFLEKTRDAAQLAQARPAAVICSRAADPPVPNKLRCDAPRLAFARALAVFHPAPAPARGIHIAAVVHEQAEVAPDAEVAPCAVVERGAHIGAGARIGAGCFVGQNARIGAGCVLHPRVTVLHDCELGERVILHSGVVIGADGFGYVPDDKGRQVKMPQVGRVVIEDDVEIGANSAVDRATLGETRIGAGTKIDNLVQVGHNCRIGRGVIICGSVGISGSVTIGHGAVLAGQAGISDHVTIGERAIIGGKAGVIDNVPPGKFYSGMPAVPHRSNMAALSKLQRLPELFDDMKQLNERIEELTKES